MSREFEKIGHVIQMENWLLAVFLATRPFTPKGSVLQLAREGECPRLESGIGIVREEMESEQEVEPKV